VGGLRGSDTVQKNAAHVSANRLALYTDSFPKIPYPGQPYFGCNAGANQIFRYEYKRFFRGAMDAWLPGVHATPVGAVSLLPDSSMLATEPDPARLGCSSNSIRAGPCLWRADMRVGRPHERDCLPRCGRIFGTIVPRETDSRRSSRPSIESVGGIVISG